MYLDVFDQNPWGTNCWIVGDDDSSEAVLIDPGFAAGTLRELLERAGRRAAGVVLTHAHVDHAGEAGVLAGEDVPVYCHPLDAIAFDDVEAWNPGFPNPLAPVKDLRPIEDGQRLAFEGFWLDVAHTPGHTPGHCTFGTGSLLFSGDLVFAGSIGRSDFTNSSASDMRASLLRFLELPDELPILPGHGPRSTVGHERATNPFLRELV